MGSRPDVARTGIRRAGHERRLPTMAQHRPAGPRGDVKLHRARGTPVLLLLNPGGLHYHTSSSCAFNRRFERGCSGRPDAYRRRLRLLAAHGKATELIGQSETLQVLRP